MKIIPTIPIEDTELKSWFERDRAYIELRNADSTILEFWDEDVFQLVEDGFLHPHDWHNSLYEYAVYLGVIKAGNRKNTTGRIKQ